MKKQDRTFCCTDVRTQGPWVYFHYPGTPRVLRAEFAPLLHTAYPTNRSPEIYLPKPRFLLFVGVVPWDTGG
ncbi:rCG42393 [Rattus norvegicus]|uniref:RCG42393 n=1 Tax=Rattus norvegicus TaxID=10116 RepID=A6KG01_RAT|nr:rCG42393 [Rattus norvegicus]